MSDLLRQDHPVGAPGELVAVTGLPKPSLQPCPHALGGVEIRLFHVSTVPCNTLLIALTRHVLRGGRREVVSVLIDAVEHATS